MGLPLFVPSSAIIRALGIHENTLYSWVAQGKLVPAAMLTTLSKGRPEYLFDHATCASFLEQEIELRKEVE